MQSELGDYDPIEHGTSIDYLRDFDFAPCQSDDLLEKIMEIHRTTLKVSHFLKLRDFECNRLPFVIGNNTQDSKTDLNKKTIKNSRQAT